MTLRYPCLILDHDDTVVDSTETCNYPSFQKSLAHMRPGAEITMEDFVNYSFEPGFLAMCRDIYGFSEEEVEMQYHRWKADITDNRPPFVEGMIPLLKRYRAAGGHICTVSHSDSSIITGDYMANCGFAPEIIFGWDCPEEQRKPSPYPVEEILRRLGLEASRALVVDDLKPGLTMARAAGADFAAAGWCCPVRRVADYMKEHADYYFSRVSQLESLLFTAQ